MANSRKWTYDLYLDTVKEYNSRSEFYRNNRSLYETARKNKWLQDYQFPGDKETDSKSGYVVYAYVDEDTLSAYVGVTKNIKNRNAQHKRKSKRTNSYDSVMQYFFNIGKVLPEPIVLEDGLTMSDSRRQGDFWRKFYDNRGYLIINKAKTAKSKANISGALKQITKDFVDEEVKKYKTLREFRMSHASAFYKSAIEGWLQDYDWLMNNGRAKKWTFESAMDEAMHCDTLVEFKAMNGKLYALCEENGWLDKFRWLGSRQWRHWTKDECIEESKKYWTFSEFYQNAHGAYETASANGWLDEFTWLKKSKKQYIANSGNQMEIAFDW